MEGLAPLHRVDQAESVSVADVSFAHSFAHIILIEYLYALIANTTDGIIYERDIALCYLIRTRAHLKPRHFES